MNVSRIDVSFSSVSMLSFGPHSISSPQEKNSDNGPTSSDEILGQYTMREILSLAARVRFSLVILVIRMNIPQFGIAPWRSIIQSYDAVFLSISAARRDAYCVDCMSPGALRLRSPSNVRVFCLYAGGFPIIQSR